MGSFHSFNGNVIDLEASGLASNSYPIEVGIVLGNGQSFEALIKPQPHWQHWDKEAEAIHGIDRAQLVNDGQDLQHVCQQINELCSGKTLYSDCWVHDARWLNLMFAEAGMKMTFQCSPMEMFLSDEELDNWLEHKNEFCRATDISPHRALNDAIIIAETLERRMIPALGNTKIGTPNLVIERKNQETKHRSVA